MSWWFHKCCKKKGQDCFVCQNAPLGPWVIDLGFGGWVDDMCEKCDEVAGEFTTGDVGVYVCADGGTCCAWQYFAGAWCLAGINSLRILLSIINLGGDPVQWRYHLTVRTAGLGGAESTAQYESNPTTNSDCQGEFVAGKIPLTKVSEVHIAAWAGHGACTGALPATVYAWPEP